MGNKSLLLFFILIFPHRILFAQEALDSMSQPFNAQLNLIGKSYGDSVVLRWAPTTPGAWSYLNKTGYVIERASFTDENNFNPAEYQRLSDVPLLPLPLADWEGIVNQGPDKELSAIAAQAVYGKSFNTAGATLFDAADEFANRYSFALLSADLSAVTAEALGLRFSDKSVEKGRYYIYRVYPVIPGTNYHIDTAFLVLQNLPVTPVPQPKIEKVYEGELNINIAWEKASHEPVFSAYYIERSEDGVNFDPLNKIPFINPESDNIENKSTLFQYTDSIPENYKPYFYRLIGITPFGEKSPPSEVFRAMGRDKTPPPAPINVKANQIGDGAVEITWELSEKVPDLDGFYIGRGDDLDKNFQPIHDQKIPKDSTSFIDYNSDRLSGNYYVVAAVDTAGNGSISMVSYAAVVDSIPPAAPKGLGGTIDSTGVVTLTWELGDEIDLAGYMVYFTNAADHVYSTVNQAPLADTIYTDTIQIKTLTRHVYYKIKAVDTRWNYSDYSDALELTRPDIIPPTTPVFSNYKLTEDGINLEWIPSSSEDVMGYDLEIYSNQELVRVVYVEKRDSLQLYTYIDKKIEPGNLYTYVVKAVDESGLRSEPSNPLSVKSVDFKPKESIDNLSILIIQSENSVQLNWSYDPAEKLKRFILYRAVEGATFVTYKSLSPTENSFKDSMIRKGIKYEYTIKAVYDNGKQTPFSNIVSASIE